MNVILHINVHATVGPVTCMHVKNEALDGEADHKDIIIVMVLPLMVSQNGPNMFASICMSNLASSQQDCRIHAHTYAEYILYQTCFTFNLLL